MERLIEATSVIVACSVAAIVMSLVDVVYLASDFTWDLFVVALSLGVTAGALVGAFLSVVLLLLYMSRLRFGDADSSFAVVVDDFLALLIRDGGFDRSALVVTLILVAITAVLARMSDLILKITTNPEVVIVLYALWVTAAAVVPVIVVRVVSSRRPRFSPNAPVLWAMLSIVAYIVTVEYWAGASLYTTWGAVPFIVSPAAAAVFTLLRRSRRASRVALALVALSVVTSLAVFANYPSFQRAHADIHGGPVFASGSWYILAALTDFDRDRASSVLGDTDCDGFDREQRPTAMEIVGNGVDDNCVGGELADYELSPVPEKVPTMGHRHPPVIVISVDCLRADAVGRTIDGRDVSPTIDALSQGGLTFTNAYSTSSSTDEAFPSLWTGMYPADWHQHGIYFGVEPTIAEVLGVLGYESIAVLVHPWLRYSLFYGFEIVDNSVGGQFIKRSTKLTGDETTRIALDRVDSRDPARPLLLWTHYFDPHMPRLPIGALDDWMRDDPYLQAVHMADRAIATLLTGLDERGLLDDAVIIFVSDHGEGLGEHNILTHGWSVWESLIRIPIIMRLPGVGAATFDERVSLVDVLPTLFDYLGVDDGVRRDGRSLMPLIAGGEWEPAPIFIEMPVDHRPTHWAVLDGDLKYWIDLRSESYRLYDVKRDPGETNNLIDARPDDVRRLHGILGAWRDQMYNDRRLERKRDMWESRSSWKPREFVGGEDTLVSDE